MKSTNCKNLKISENFKNSCKKTLCKVAVVGVLATSIVAPITAQAYVDPCTIVADQHYYGNSNRQSIRNSDVSTIDNMFTNNVSLEKVSAAIELSDAVNCQLGWNPQYANTNLREVKNLQPVSLLNGLERARRNGTQWTYCNNLHDELAAIDAYTMFGCKTVSEEIKEAIGKKVAAEFRGYGMNVTKTKVVIECNEAYVLLSNSSSVLKVNLYGSYLDEIRYNVTTLDDKYERVTNNMRYPYCEAEPSFVYNGVNRNNGQSVWLSLADDERKALLRSGIETVNFIKNTDSINVDCSNYYSKGSLNYYEKQALRDMGYTSRQVNNGKTCSASLQRAWVYQPQFNGCNPQPPQCTPNYGHNNGYNSGMRYCSGCEVDYRPHYHE